MEWHKIPTQILDSSNPPFYRWFSDGILNITENCLDRHAKKHPNRVAFYYEGPIAKEKSKITYKELHNKVEKFAGVLHLHGIEKGDRVIIYMPMIIHTAIAMLACARLGVIHSVVFGGFSS